MSERDIDVVLVTGAGASRNFGVNGTRLPLMSDWATALVKSLSERPGFLRATGLRASMSGEEFESTLGEFLRGVQAFRGSARLINTMTELPSPTGASPLPADTWLDWHRERDFHLGQIIEVIHRSLHELFGAQSYDPGAVATGYGSLLRSLGIGPASRWAVATTNYDLLAEKAIEETGGLPDVGAVISSRYGTERRLQVDGLINGMPRYVPVLHLHGAVGWLRRTQDDTTIAVPGESYDPSFGVPIVMLPDLEKDYATDPLIASIWRQFEEIVARAKRTVVLGHSLHDQALVGTLATRADRVAVTVMPDAPPQERERITSLLPAAEQIPLEFGPSPETADLYGWAHSGG